MDNKQQTNVRPCKGSLPQTTWPDLPLFMTRKRGNNGCRYCESLTELAWFRISIHHNSVDVFCGRCSVGAQDVGWLRLPQGGAS